MAAAATDELEAAVLICLNPPAHPPDTVVRAAQITAQVRDSPRAVEFALERLTPAARPELAFWLLQLLHSAVAARLRPAAAAAAKPPAASRPAVLAYACAVTAAGAPPQPPYVRNKLAQLLVAHVAVEYPSEWPGAMRETVLPLATDAAGRTPATLDLFFRVMRTLDAEVTSIVAAQSSAAAREVSVRVKDAIRDDCASDLVGLLATLVNVPAYADHAYDLVARNVEWLDIALFTNDAFLPAMYAAITSAAPAPTRAASAYALRAILSKRMPMNSKLALLQHLQVLQLLAAFPSSIPDDDEAGHAAAECAPRRERTSTADLAIQSGHHESAVLVNCIATIALDSLRALIPGGAKNDPPPAYPRATVEGTSAIAEAALPLALRFVSADMDEAVSQEALKCVTAYINVFGRLNAAAAATPAASEDAWTHGREGLVATLHVIEERACFPPDYDPTDDEHPFRALRRVLLHSVVRGIARSNASVVLAFVRRIALRSETPASVPRTELVLTLLSILAESSLDIPGLPEVLLSAMSNPPRFAAVTPDMPATAARQLEAAQVAHLELVVRAYRLVLVSADPGVLAAVLAPFFDDRGLQNRSSRAVRSRAIYLLLKLTRPLRSPISTRHLAAVMGAIRPLMFPVHPRAAGQAAADQMMVFEIAGLLVGTDSSRPESVNYLGALLQAVVDALHAATTTEQMIGAVTAAGQLSKGFGGDTQPFLQAGHADGGSPPVSPGGTVTVAVNGARGGDGQRRGPADCDSHVAAAAEVRLQKPKAISEQSLGMWTAALEAILASVGLMGPECSVLPVPPASLDPMLREKTVFVLHRMVDTMGVSVIPYLGAVLQLLLTGASSPAEVRGVLVLASQAVSKFGKAFQIVVTSVFADMVRRVYECPPAIDASTMLAMSEEARECVELRKAYYYLLSTILTADIPGVFLAERNAVLVPGVVSSLVDAVIGRDVDVRAAPTVMKMCMSSLARMVGHWVTPFGVDAVTGFGDVNGQPRGFTQYVVEEVAPATVRSCVESNLFRGGDFASGGVVAVIGENVALQRTCAVRVGPAFGEALQARGFGALLPARRQDVATYTASLYASGVSTRSLSKMFIALVKAVRTQPPGAVK